MILLKLYWFIKYDLHLKLQLLTAVHNEMLALSSEQQKKGGRHTDEINRNCSKSQITSSVNSEDTVNTTNCNSLDYEADSETLIAQSTVSHNSLSFPDHAKETIDEAEPGIANSFNQSSDTIDIAKPSNGPYFGSSLEESYPIPSDKFPPMQMSQYEEFSENEIAEAKNSFQLMQHPEKSATSTTLPEPHCASPIREVLLTLQKEASKYRNIQVLYIVFYDLSLYNIVIEYRSLPIYQPDHWFNDSFILNCVLYIYTSNNVQELKLLGSQNIKCMLSFFSYYKFFCEK